MLFKGNITPGTDVNVECTAKHTNQGPSLVSVAEFPAPGQAVRPPLHLPLAPGGASNIVFPDPAGFALRIDIDVIEPDEVRVRVTQNGQFRAEAVVNADQTWIFSEAV